MAADTAADIAEVIAYTCIFQKTPEGAVLHILGHIRAGNPDFGATREECCARIKALLAGERSFTDLNRAGAEFTDDAWREILTRVVARLEGP